VTTNPRWSIRAATEADIPGVLACLGEAFEPYRSEYSPGAYLDTVLTPGTAQERLRSMAVFVACDRSGIVVGTVALGRGHETEGHLRGMAVVPAYQGTGVGGALLGHAIGVLAGMGCSSATLDTTRPLARAARFYEKNGFRRSGKVVDFFGMPLEEWRRELV
jgi:N-acetylglutamate synthase-like GNAT family acetyltransferase